MHLAVETADIVKSTSLGADEFKHIYQVLNDELTQLSTLYQTDYETYRGDAYQVCYQSPEIAVKCAILTRLRLLFEMDNQPVFLTQSIAIGEQDIDNKMGDIFILSGRQLDKIKRGQFCVQFANHDGAKDVSMSTLFLSDLLNHLTQKQAQALYWYIKNDFAEHHLVASALKTTRQNVSTHLARAKADLVKHYIEYVAQLIEETC